MDIHHYPSTSIEPGSRSRAAWARLAPSQAVVFIHGFRGDTTRTFHDLPGLLVRQPKAAASDIFLFGYESSKVNAGAAADQAGEFLDALGTDPKTKIMDTAVPPSWRRSAPFTYQRILIVAHSLGAIVSRLALLRAHRRDQRPVWLDRVELSLYAPAHLGATIEELVRESVFGPFFIFVKANTPVLNTLAKGSPLLNELERDTKAILAGGGATNHVRAVRVVHSMQDKVVEADARFGADPDPIYVEQFRTHSTVCKAESAGAKPLTLLLEVL